MEDASGQVPATAVSALYNQVAVTYSATGPAVFTHFGHRLVEHAALAPGDCVLDVGVGRGAITFPAARRVGVQGHVTGIDVAPAMLHETAGEAQRSGLANITLRVMDGDHLAFPDCSFDAVLCGFTIFFLDSERALRAFYRVLRPGGRVAMTCSAGDDARFHWYNDLLLAYHATYGVPLSPPRRGASWTPGDLPHLLARADFAHVETITEEAEFRYADAQEWWQAKWTHGARYPLERMRPAVLNRFQAEVFSHLAPLQQADGVHERWRIMTVRGVRPG